MSSETKIQHEGFSYDVRIDAKGVELQFDSSKSWRDKRDPPIIAARKVIPMVQLGDGEVALASWVRSSPWVIEALVDAGVIMEPHRSIMEPGAKAETMIAMLATPIPGKVGRPREYAEPQIRRSIHLPKDLIEKAERIGGGKKGLAKGIRTALEAYEE